jgi:hypothetical protein
MRTITTRAELVELARELGVRQDWHEPDEQEITAVPAGDPLNFDNAFPAGYYYGPDNRSELHIVLHRMVWEDNAWRLGKPIAAVNLATLFAWATGHEFNVDAYAAETGERAAQAILAQCEGSHLDFGNGLPDDCEHQRYAALVREVASAQSTSDAVTAAGIEMLRKWQAKMMRQAEDANDNTDRGVAILVADAFGTAARMEQAQVESKRRHPSASVRRSRA